MSRRSAWTAKRGLEGLPPDPNRTHPRGDAGHGAGRLACERSGSDAAGTWQAARERSPPRALPSSLVRLGAAGPSSMTIGGATALRSIAGPAAGALSALRRMGTLRLRRTRRPGREGAEGFLAGGWLLRCGLEVRAVSAAWLPRAILRHARRGRGTVTQRASGRGVARPLPGMGRCLRPGRLGNASLPVARAVGDAGASKAAPGWAGGIAPLG